MLPYDAAGLPKMRIYNAAGHAYACLHPRARPQAAARKGGNAAAGLILTACTGAGARRQLAGDPASPWTQRDASLPFACARPNALLAAYLCYPFSAPPTLLPYRPPSPYHLGLPSAPGLPASACPFPGLVVTLVMAEGVGARPAHTPQTPAAKPHSMDLLCPVCRERCSSASIPSTVHAPEPVSPLRCAHESHRYSSPTAPPTASSRTAARSTAICNRGAAKGQLRTHPEAIVSTAAVIGGPLLLWPRAE
jgi:hypothetical protein